MSLYTYWIFYAVVLMVFAADVVFVLRRVLPVYDVTLKTQHVVESLQKDGTESEAYTRAWSTMNKVRFYNLESYTHQIVTMLIAFGLVSWLWISNADKYLFALAIVPWATLGLICWMRWYLDQRYEQISEMYLKGLLQNANPFERDKGHLQGKVATGSVNPSYARVSYKSST